MGVFIVLAMRSKASMEIILLADEKELRNLRMGGEDVALLSSGR
jgi:hypothetical protein